MKLKKKMLILTSVMLVALFAATPAIASSYTVTSSCPPCSADKPIMINPATNEFSFYAPSIDRWIVNNDTLTTNIRLNGDWAYPAEVVCSIEDQTLADGYKELPSRFITFTESQMIGENEWAPFTLQVNLPNGVKYYNQHYQISLSYCAVCNDNMGMCCGKVFHFVTPEKANPRKRIGTR